MSTKPELPNNEELDLESMTDEAKKTSFEKLTVKKSD
jgi:hypothetical protein